MPILFFFFNDTATTEIYTLSLHDALPISIKRAVRAGVASVEHGSLIDDEGIRLMKEHGTYLVADIYNDDYIIAEYTRLGFPQQIIDKERLVGRQQRENFKKAVQAGVKSGHRHRDRREPH